MDDEGALHVVEALMAGVVILTAIIFLNATAAPSPAGAISGVDLSQHAIDVLDILVNEEPTENVADGNREVHPTWSSRLEEIISHALADETDVAADRAHVDELVGIGNRWQLRLDNGYDPIVVLTTEGDFGAIPRGAKAAERFITPHWDGNGASGCGTLAGSPFYPGETLAALPFTSGGDLQAPVPSTVTSNGARNGPDGVAWSSWWEANDPDTGTTKYTVPTEAIFGTWRDADSNTCFTIQLPGRAFPAPTPTYGVQLVVWPIAG